MARPANPELREKILKAAAGIIEDCGPDCVTMRQVAEEVGYSSTTLYLYFKDKNDILRAAMLRAFDDLADACNLAMVGPTNIDRFRQRCRGYIMWGLMNPGHYRLMFEGSSEIDLTPDELRRSMRGIEEGGKIYAAAIEAGEVPPIQDGQTFAVACWSALHGVTSLAIGRRLIAGMGERSPQELVDLATRAADRLINALLASEAEG